MKVNKEIKLNNGKIEIVTKQEHRFTEVQKKILKSLALNGYYELICNNGNPAYNHREYPAIQIFIKLGLVKEDYDARNYTVEVVKSEEVGSFFLQIIKEGI